MSESDYGSRVHEHVHHYFSGHVAHREEFDEGPVQSMMPGFHVIALEPGPRTELWTYISVGSGFLEHDGIQRLEFLITADEPSARHVQRLGMTTFYHHTETLGLGHTFPLGDPWLPDSTLDHALISLPYPFGQDREVFCSDGDHVNFYWILPITAAESAFRHANGLDALESIFRETGMNYTDASRASVV